MRVAVVVASINARATIRASLGRFVEEVGNRGEVIVVDASRDGTADEASRLFPTVRVLRRPAGWLAPELWSEGLEETDTPRVAFSTAQMVPGPGWLGAMLSALEETGAAAVGGPIVPAEGLSATDRAVCRLRYAGYHPPLPRSGPFEPPGDNALYRRDRLSGLEAAWTHGFWEVEIHRLLRQRGEVLAPAPEAVVTFAGGSRLAPMLGQRLVHARHYAAGRFANLGLFPRMARSATAPMVPAVLMARIVSTLRSRGLPLRTSPGEVTRLALLLTAWSAGETAGLWLGRPERRGL